METTRQCIKVSELRKDGYESLELWLSSNELHIYVGRSNGWVKGAHKSIWHNPFSIKKYGIQECLMLYQKHIMENIDLMLRLKELKGKVLGCWCLPNCECHCDILITMIG